MSKLLPAALIAAVTIPCAACSPGNEVPPSGVLEAAEATQGTSRSVTLPSGVLDFTVGHGVTQLAAEDTADNEAYSAPDGEEFVPVSWSQSSTAPHQQLAVQPGAQFPPAQLSLGTEGDWTEFDTFDLGEGESSGQVWVSVPEGSDLSIAVDFDGESQSVNVGTGERDPGAAADFYSTAVPSTPPCPTQKTDVSTAMQWRLTCQVDGVASVPYLADEGWAGEGNSWLVVDLTTAPQQATFSTEHGESSYRIARTLRDSTRLAGKNPDAVLADDALGDGQNFTSVAYKVETGWSTLDLTVRRAYELARRSGTVGPPTSQASARLTLTLDAQSN